MAGIQDYLNSIKSAIYGKDVRQAIHDGILQCYLDASGVHFETLDRDVNALKSRKVNQPLDRNNQPINGTNGQSLRTKGDGTTEWASVGLPTDAQTAEAITEWLNAHPEATTTVQDESLTHNKLVKGTMGYVTPQMFGAKGNGITDDSVAFLACFDGTFKNILIPEGNYLVSEKITIPDGTIVACDGVIEKDGNFDILFEVGNDCDIQLNIDVGKASATSVTSQTSADIKISGKHDVRVHNTTIKSTDSRYAIWVNESDNVIIESCTIDTYIESAIGLRDGNNNVKVLSNTVVNGHDGSLNKYPICINSSSNDQIVSRNIVCDGNYIEDTTPSWEGIDAHNLENSAITNNVIINTITGIAIVNRQQESKNIAISNNIYKSEFESNVDASTFGITCSVFGGSKDIVINGNTLYNCGNNIGTTDRGGMKLQGAENMIVSNNVVSVAHGNGMLIASGDTTVMTDFIVSDNIVDGADIGIKLVNALGINISGIIKENIIKNCNVGLSGNEQYGVGYGYVVYAKDNTFENCVTNYDELTHGTIASPYYTNYSAYGKAGMVLENINPETGRIVSMCIKSGTDEDIAEWYQIHHQISFSGDYNANANGVVAIFDDRIKSTMYAIVTNMYKSSSSFGVILTAECENGRLNIYCRNHDGTNYTGAMKLGILIIP